MQNAQRALVIEDDEDIVEQLRSHLGERGVEISLARSGDAGLSLLKSGRFELILINLVMPELGGMDLLKEAISSQRGVPVVVMAAVGSVQNAVEAMRAGAFDYLAKPFNLDELMNVLNRALASSQQPQENIILKKQHNFKGIIGDCLRMQGVYDLIEKIADTDSTVLISGESGTGKELIAKTIHFNNGTRAGGPFVPLNCGAIPKDLLESELFGHEKGSFTGAINTRVGRFELAQGGTLFLDEVGELDPSLQVKLLRVLQEREFERVGGMKTIKVDVRILAATNKDLEQATNEGKFREDLFYRLNVIPLHLPPLRDRIEDIMLLTSHFVLEFSRKRKREPFSFSPEAMECMLRYRWPGNVRELENLIERLSILVSGKIVNVFDLPEKFHQTVSVGMERATDATVATPRPVSSPPLASPRHAGIEFGDSGINLNEMVSTMERNLIMQALERARGVRSKAAQLLGLNRTTLLEKMKKMGIEIKKK